LSSGVDIVVVVDTIIVTIVIVTIVIGGCCGGLRIDFVGGPVGFDALASTRKRMVRRLDLRRFRASDTGLRRGRQSELATTLPGRKSNDNKGPWGRSAVSVHAKHGTTAVPKKSAVVVCDSQTTTTIVTRRRVLLLFVTRKRQQL
jgi:hypothetical protein